MEAALYIIIGLLIVIVGYQLYKFLRSTGRIMTKKKRMAAKKAAAVAKTSPKPTEPVKPTPLAIPTKYAEEETLIIRGSASNLSDDILELYNKDKAPEETRSTKDNSQGGQRSARIERKYKEIKDRYSKKFGDLIKAEESDEAPQSAQTNSNSKNGSGSQIDVNSDSFKRIFVSDVLKKKPE